MKDHNKTLKTDWKIQAKYLDFKFKRFYLFFQL